MKDKIKKDILNRSIVKNFKYLPQSGNAQHEYDYRYCKSKVAELKDYYFVVSKYLRYNGNSMDDYGYNIYVYDKNGDFVENADIEKIKNTCKGKFFSNLIDLE